ncbi:hypothetical protein POTOM_055353 [Populus tomentosa]|uniref:EF-hand domain-containing protein n=1 Tax=Populus tomentosa TaxID=118781 RepID=A0A8X8C417_POPTO|nr:hypothetical protein POTOM_055353 [Populus tomentosa]
MDDIRKIFNKFDKNGDGKISCSEVVDNLKELGTKISPAEVQSIMQEFDKDGDGYIDLDEFVDFIQNGGIDDGGGNDSKELRDAFDLYDKNKNGLISADELHSQVEPLINWRKMCPSYRLGGKTAVKQMVTFAGNLFAFLGIYWGLWISYSKLPWLSMFADHWYK